MKPPRLSPRGRNAIERELSGLNAMVNRLLPELDVQTDTCTCCELDVARHFGDVQARDAIAVFAKKLRKILEADALASEAERKAVVARPPTPERK